MRSAHSSDDRRMFSSTVLPTLGYRGPSRKNSGVFAGMGLRVTQS